MRDKMIFLVGAQRSGTNWLQRMLATHPAIVAVPSETHLFSHGLAPLTERFQHGAATSTSTGTVFMEREQLRAALRGFADQVFAQLADVLNPRATHILERTPLHVHHLDLIGEVYPDAAVIHIIRDGRDVARSQVAQEWGPKTMTEAAREWATAISDARSANVPRYREVRYEDLLADPAPRTAELLEWAGLPVDDEQRDAIAMEAAVQFNVSRSHPGVSEGKWRSALDPDELRAFEAEAGELLRELGYPAVEAPPAPAPAERASLVKSGLRRVAGRAAAPLRRTAAQETTDAPDQTPVHFSMVTTQHYMATVGELVDRFLGLIAQRDYERLRALVTPETRVKLSGRNVGRDEQGYEQLVEALRVDEPSRGHLIKADGVTNALGSTIVQTYEGADGSVSDTVFVLGVKYLDGQVVIEQLVYHRLETAVAVPEAARTAA